MTTSDDFRERISNLLGETGDHTEIFELRRRVVARGSLTRRRLLDALDEFAKHPRLLEDERSRVLLARLIAASAPESLQTIKLVLADSPGGQSAAELQFSLFVALEDVPRELSVEDVSAIAKLVEQYLCTVVTDVAEAAWMAGDMLGDHWPLELSLPVLLRVVRGAKHRAGREGAIHGLSHALVRASKLQQWQIIDALQLVAAQDSDETVRQYAESVIAELRGL